MRSERAGIPSHALFPCGPNQKTNLELPMSRSLIFVRRRHAVLPDKQAPSAEILLLPEPQHSSAGQKAPSSLAHRSPQASQANPVGRWGVRTAGLVRFQTGQPGKNHPVLLPQLQHNKMSFISVIQGEESRVCHHFKEAYYMATKICLRLKPGM